MTKKNIQKEIAIVLDNKVYSAPTVQSEITEGACQITGDFTKNELEMMAVLLNSASIPGKPRVISVQKINK